MKKVISIGEALIDFIPHEKGVALKDVSNFFRVAGGAPLNVAAAVAKLGGKAQMLTKLGVDGFGDHILEEVSPLGVDVSKVLRTKEANTALAFVSLKEDGERDFSFYRNPSADMLLNAEEIEEEVFAQGGILHFCSVSLIDAPIKEAHRKAIEFANYHQISRIVLIDGEKLTNLMIDYGVGLSTEHIYKIQNIDKDYFDEDKY